MSPSHISWPQNVEWYENGDSIREKFNSCQFYERLQNNELTATTFKSKHRSPATEPKCTLSQVLIYWDSQGNPVAMVHQYLRPDGIIGGGGKPDPKWVVVDDKVMALRAKAK
jgi:hypothetical protein